MAITINIDNNSIRDAIKKIKYVRFINLIIRQKEKYLDEKIFSSKKLLFNTDDDCDIDVYELEFGNKTIPLIDLLFFQYPNSIFIDYIFQPRFLLDDCEEDEREEIIKQNTEIEKYIKEDFKLDDYDIETIYMNAEECGDIPLFCLYNEKISKAISLIINNKEKLEELENELNDIVKDNIYHERGILSAIMQKGKDKYCLGFISAYHEIEQFYYCSYDLYKFYNKCLDILKDNNVKVGD